jgi:hypothetical protein
MVQHWQERCHLQFHLRFSSTPFSKGLAGGWLWQNKQGVTARTIVDNFQVEVKKAAAEGPTK